MILEYQNRRGTAPSPLPAAAICRKTSGRTLNLFVYRGETKEYHSMTAPAALIDALVVAVSEKLGDEAVQRLSNLHR